MKNLVFTYGILLLLILSACVRASVHQKTLDDLAGAESYIQQLKNQIQSQDANISELKKKVRDVQTLVSQLESQEISQASDIELLVDRNKRLAEELHKSDRRVKDLLDLLDQQAFDFQALESKLKNQESLQAEVEALSSLLRKNSDDLEFFRKKTHHLERSILEPQEKLSEIHSQLSGLLKKEIADRNVELTRTNEQLKILFSQEVLFPSGDVEIQSEGRQILQRVGMTIKELSKDLSIEVQGHSDNVPIGPRLLDRYQSNWELSAARASRVVQHLYQQLGDSQAPPFSAIGFSDTRPVSENSTEEGRAKNRRIEIILKPWKNGDSPSLE